ncbi:unnamed protein product [Fusarium langsethiae]|nr:unnamed protein product [Fusarium langsethiae]
MIGYRCSLNPRPASLESYQLYTEPIVLEYWGKKGRNAHEKAGPGPIAEDADHRFCATGLNVFHVLKMINHDEHRGKARYLQVQWCGYAADEATREPLRKVWKMRKAIVIDHYERHNRTLPANLDYDDPPTGLGLFIDFPLAAASNEDEGFGQCHTIDYQVRAPVPCEFRRLVVKFPHEIEVTFRAVT